MRMTLAAVGRMRDEPEAALFERYWQRAEGLGPKLGFNNFATVIVDTSRRANAAARAAEEAQALGRRLDRDAQIIALDERGRSFSSDAFAAQLAALRDGGASGLAFVIGGPDGLAAEIRNAARLQLAFGAQTWPHLMVRAMLAEQIYRALSILAGHPYHRA